MTDRDRWRRLATARPETLILWYRTSPEPLVPYGSRNPVAGQNPPLNVGGMTLVVVDASGRLAEFIAVPPPFDAGSTPQPSVNWNTLFEAAGLQMSAFAPTKATIVPPVHAD